MPENHFNACKSIIDKLQHVQNTAACTISKTSRTSHITPVLKQLQWLSVKYCAQYKILVRIYKALNDQSPAYMSGLLKVH